MKLLGIDYGTKNVGIALSDEDQTQAFPRSVLQNNKELVEKIKHICKEESVEAVIIGESLDYKGEDNPLMKRIRKFIDILEKETGLSVFTEPEYLTSEQAKRLKVTF
jgi:putative holliday junction resolvase